MTRKHYNMIAEVFRGSKPFGMTEGEYNLWLNLVHAMADQLKRDNPNFKHEQFFVACGK